MTESFIPLGQAVRKSKGMPNLPLVVLPRSVEYMPKPDLEKAAEKALDQALASIAPKAAARAAKEV